MPRHEASPAAVTANFVLLDKGHYSFKIGEGKTFAKDNSEKSKSDSFGVRYALTVASPSHAAGQKPAPANLYQHSVGAQGFSKQFLIAAMGFRNNAEGEAAFNEAASSLDWSFDTDTGELGSGWASINGSTIEADVEVTPEKKDRDGNTLYAAQNSFKWMPLKTN